MDKLKEFGAFFQQATPVAYGFEELPNTGRNQLPL